MKNKLCLDCKWCDGDKDFPTCSNLRNHCEKNYATGEKKVRWDHCNILREDGFIGSRMMKTCGRKARFFEPKETSSSAPKEKQE